MNEILNLPRMWKALPNRFLFRKMSKELQDKKLLCQGLQRKNKILGCKFSGMQKTSIQNNEKDLSSQLECKSFEVA